MYLHFHSTVSGLSVSNTIMYMCLSKGQETFVATINFVSSSLQVWAPYLCLWQEGWLDRLHWNPGKFISISFIDDMHDNLLRVLQINSTLAQAQKIYTNF